MPKNGKKALGRGSERLKGRSPRLGITVFVSGALCMALEMTGARLLAPYAGTSAVVWTSVVGITLAFLSLGNWLGGKLADRRKDALSISLCCAGIGCLVPAFAGHAAAAFVSSLSQSVYLTAVICGILVFALPATFFGMVLPCATKAGLEADGKTGESVGRIYALSTAGSILGTFLGGFVLISFFGSSAILLGTGFAMLALGAWSCAAKPAVPAAAAACGIILLFSGSGGAAGWTLIETPHNSIRLMEGSDRETGARVRMMATDPGGGGQSAIDVDNPDDLYFKYTRFYAMGPAMRPDAKRILMLGGGGYSVPRWLLSGKSALRAKPGLVRVVELDPAMTDTARKWFGLKDDPALQVIHEDARAFLNRNREKHDLVFVDIFNSHYSIPFHVATAEAFEKLKGAVDTDGVLMMNLISGVEGDAGRLFRAVWPNFRKSFRHAAIFMVSDPENPEKIQNLMLVGSDGDLGIRDFGEHAAPGREEIEGMLRNRREDEIPADVHPLTDDFAPVERYGLR